MSSSAPRLVRAAAAVVALLTASFGTACSSGGPAQPVPSPAPAAPAATAPPTPAAPPPAPPVTVPTCEPVHVPPWNPANFRDPTKITNPWMPLVPGTQFTAEGSSNIGGRPTEHKIVFTVTDLVKEIDGVQTRVGWDVDTNKGVLAESELVFFAQDNDGNVWTVGEYPEEYANGKLTGAPKAWAAGVNGAEAGVQIRGKPAVGAGEYLQGISSSVEFLDCAKDVSTGQHTCVPAGCYDNVLVVDERSPQDPDSGVQRKYYAPAVGYVRVEALGDPEGETLMLTRIAQPSTGTLDTARTEALKLDQRARQGAVYKNTAPAHTL
jgi:hypothetical protein